MFLDLQGTAEERAAISRANRRIVQLTLDAFQRRWARLLEAMYASDLEAYAGSGGGEAAPVSLAGFREVTEISSEVVKLCASDGRTATGLVSILQVLGKHLLKVRCCGCRVYKSLSAVIQHIQQQSRFDLEDNEWDSPASAGRLLNWPSQWCKLVAVQRPLTFHV